MTCWREATLSTGARNLTDEDPPPLPSKRTGVRRYKLRPGFQGYARDIKGRTIYFSFRWCPRACTLA